MAGHPTTTPPRTEVDRASVALLATVIALTGVSLPIMSVAIPALDDAYPDWTAADLSWVTNVFTIVGAGTMIPAGVFADRLGRKRLLLGGAALFLAGSLLGALAPGPELVIVGRAVQAVGASAFTPAGVALMVAAFPPERLASAMGTWAIAGGVASAAGPGLGGIVIDGLGWRWAFWLVVPLALAVLVAGPRVLHEAARPETDRRLPDLVGAALIMAAATAITLALVKGPSWGWLDRRTLLAAAVGVAGVAVVLVRSAHHPSPIIELGLFRLRTVQLGNAGTFTFSFSWFGMFFGLVLFLDQSWGWSLLEAGLASAPVPLLAGLCGVWVGRRADVAGHRRYVVPGALVYGAAAAWFALFLDDEPNLFVLLVGIVAIGVASGMVFPSMQAVALYGVPPDRHGMASAIMFTIQRLSITFGVALVLGLLGTTTSVTPIVWVMFVGAVAAGLIGAAVDTRPRP